MLMSGHMEQLTVSKPSPYQREWLAKPFSISTLLKRVRDVPDSDSNPLDFEPPLNSRWLCGSG
jgi:hypothetical protein